MKQTKLKCGLVILFFFSIFFVGQKVIALTISPSLVRMELAPGQSKKQTINLYNETDQPVTFYSAVENFSLDANINTPIFLGNNDSLGAARWFFVTPSQVTLQSGEKKEAVLTVKAPFLAEPGGHYAGVLWSDIPPKDGGVKTANRLAVLFLITVEGEVQEDLQIVSFEKKTQTEIDFNLEIENKGNVHLQPVGQVQILDNKNNLAAIIPINYLKQTILPQSRRSFALNFVDDLAWGRYRAKAQLTFGQNKMIESQEIVFWHGPKNLVYNLFGVVVFLLVILVIYKMAKKKTLKM